MLPVSNVLAVELEKIDGFHPERLRALPEVVSAEVKDGVLRIGLHELTSGAPIVLTWLSQNGCAYQHVVSERPDLETVFLTLTGRSLRDA
jgi:ABC-2 type transport system ATP-binding protein